MSQKLAITLAIYSYKCEMCASRTNLHNRITKKKSKTERAREGLTLQKFKEKLYAEWCRASIIHI